MANLFSVVSALATSNFNYLRPGQPNSRTTRKIVIGVENQRHFEKLLLGVTWEKDNKSTSVFIHKVRIQCDHCVIVLICLIYKIF